MTRRKRRRYTKHSQEKKINREETLTPTAKIVIEEEDFLGQLCGVGHHNLEALESALGAPVFALGNELHVRSEDPEILRHLDRLVENLRTQHRQGQAVDEDLILAMRDRDQDSESPSLWQDSSLSIPGGLTKVFPRGWQQVNYLNAMRSHDVTFGIGPAGTGKTYLAIAHALFEVVTKRRKKLVLTRPVVEAGENLGFLPGDLSQKISPYLRPLYDAMEDLLPAEILNRLEENRLIEIAPLAYMRGRSLKNCFVVLDEAQNTTKMQMKMFLTRLGEGAKAAITGDLTQVDLPRSQESGLFHAQKILEGLPEIHFTVFDRKDVVRSSLVRQIIDAYERFGE